VRRPPRTPCRKRFKSFLTPLLAAHSYAPLPLAAASVATRSERPLGGALALLPFLAAPGYADTAADAMRRVLN